MDKFSWKRFGTNRGKRREKPSIKLTVYMLRFESKSSCPNQEIITDRGRLFALLCVS